MDYLGHHIDAQGIHIAPGKVAPITQAPRPSERDRAPFFSRHGELLWQVPPEFGHTSKPIE